MKQKELPEIRKIVENSPSSKAIKDLGAYLAQTVIQKWVNLKFNKQQETKKGHESPFLVSSIKFPLKQLGSDNVFHYSWSLN